MEIEAFVLNDELSMSADQRIIDGVDIVEVIVNRDNNVRPPLGLGIEDNSGLRGRIVW